jgi:hypothetical protein
VRTAINLTLLVLMSPVIVAAFFLSAVAGGYRIGSRLFDGLAAWLENAP